MSCPDVFVGIDVQVRRGCAYYAISPKGEFLASGWLSGSTQAAREAEHVLAQLTSDNASRAVVGIDAPRMPLGAARKWTWSGKRKQWSMSDAPLQGRHCEVVIAALRLAKPQWTPLAQTAPEWMQVGFALFTAISATGAAVREVFPSAAYRQLGNMPGAEFPVNFLNFARGPKDMLDAAMGAFVVREYFAHRGCEVGGGDGLGTIVLPRPILAAPASLHTWPGVNTVAVQPCVAADIGIKDCHLAPCGRWRQLMEGPAA